MDRLKKIGLEHCRVLENMPAVSEAEALNWLNENAPWAEKLVKMYTREIVWLEPKQKNDASVFASTTFFEDLGTTYLTQLALNYVPPSVVCAKPSSYMLAENLYHEAIHQELYSKIEKGGVIDESARGTRGPLIDIPWRGAKWTLEHAFHAFVVYSRVLPLRRIAINLSDTVLDEKALVGAEQAIVGLRVSIEPYLHLFASAGMKELS